MGNFFGFRRKTTPQVTKQDRAVLQLKQQRDKIRIYQRKTETELAANKELALKLFQNGMKERALVVMKRRKFMEDIINRTDQQLATLQQLVLDIEFTQAEVSVVEGLKIGNQALKELTSLMNIDDIQQIMDDTQEAAEKQREITDILSRSSERYDESELLQELDSLIEHNEREILEPKIKQIPSVPKDDVIIEDNEKDKISEGSPEKEKSSPERVVIVEEQQQEDQKEAGNVSLLA